MDPTKIQMPELPSSPSEFTPLPSTAQVIDKVELQKQLEKILLNDERRKTSGSVKWDFIKKTFKGLVTPLEQLQKKAVKAMQRDQTDWTLEGLVKKQRVDGEVRVRRFTGWDRLQGKYTGEKLREKRRHEVIDAVSQKDEFHPNLTQELDHLIATQSLIDLWKPSDYNAAAAQQKLSRQVLRRQYQKQRKKTEARANAHYVATRRQKKTVAEPQKQMEPA